MVAAGSFRVELAGKLLARGRGVRVEGSSPTVAMTGCAGYGEPGKVPHIWVPRLSDEKLNGALGIVAIFPIRTRSMYDIAAVAWSL